MRTGGREEGIFVPKAMRWGGGGDCSGRWDLGRVGAAQSIPAGSRREQCCCSPRIRRGFLPVPERFGRDELRVGKDRRSWGREMPAQSREMTAWLLPAAQRGKERAGGEIRR